MSGFICPKCHEILTENSGAFKCENNHCFDKSKFGYVNLLLSNQSSLKRHGDDRMMVRARRDFLSAGYYSFLLNEMNRLVKKHLPNGGEAVDAGCGECYYSQGLATENSNLNFSGIDISKDALEFAHKRGVNFPLAVASLFSMPIADESIDIVLNCFSPFADAEFNRVLKKGGLLLTVVPLEEHLFSLKEAIYENPYLNEKPDIKADGFEIAEYTEIRNNIVLDTNDAVLNLFKMTPYFYKTGREDQEKLKKLNSFETCAAFGMFLLKKV